MRELENLGLELGANFPSKRFFPNRKRLPLSRETLTCETSVVC